MMWTLIAFALAGGSVPPATDNFGEPFPAFVPADVRLFVIDAQACAYFSSEPYEGDSDRKAFLDKMVAKSCPNLDKRKASLNRRYKRSMKIRKVVSNAWEK